MNELKEKIEEMRKYLDTILLQENNLHDREVVFASEKLDYLLNRYYEYKTDIEPSIVEQ